MASTPIVSVGLPVYNGHDFVAEAVRSIQSQTFQDWELVISDNASTDETVDTCRALAKSDSRIRLLVNDRNVGTAPNFNSVFHESRGRYFKWIAHDDYCGPEFIEECLKALDLDDEAVLALPRLVYVDANGRRLRRQSADLSIPDNTAEERVARLMRLEAQSTDIFWSLYGLIRRDALEKTRLMERFNASDQVLLLELALQGKFIQTRSDLLFRREHESAASMKTHRSASERAKWNYADDKRTFVFPYCRLLEEHLVSIAHSAYPLLVKIRCGSWVLRRFTGHWKDLVIEIASAVHSVFKGFRLKEQRSA